MWKNWELFKNLSMISVTQEIPGVGVSINFSFRSWVRAWGHLLQHTYVFFAAHSHMPTECPCGAYSGNLHPPSTSTQHEAGGLGRRTVGGAGPGPHNVTGGCGSVHSALCPLESYSASPFSFFICKWGLIIVPDSWGQWLLQWGSTKATIHTPAPECP